MSTQRKGANHGAVIRDHSDAPGAARTNEKIQDLLALAEEEQRDLADYENEQITKYRTRVGELEVEILDLSTDIERADSPRTSPASCVERKRATGATATARCAAGPPRATREGSGHLRGVRTRSADREREVRPQDPLPVGTGRPSRRGRRSAWSARSRTSPRPPSPGSSTRRTMTEILDIIDRSRPVVDSGRCRWTGAP